MANESDTLWDGWLPGRDDLVAWGEARLGINEETKQGFQQWLLDLASAAMDSVLNLFNITGSGINSIVDWAADGIASVIGRPQLTGLQQFASALETSDTLTAQLSELGMGEEQIAALSEMIEARTTGVARMSNPDTVAGNIASDVTAYLTAENVRYADPQYSYARVLFDRMLEDRNVDISPLNANEREALFTSFRGRDDVKSLVEDHSRRLSEALRSASAEAITGGTAPASLTVPAALVVESTALNDAFTALTPALRENILLAEIRETAPEFTAALDSAQRANLIAAYLAGKNGADQGITREELAELNGLRESNPAAYRAILEQLNDANRTDPARPSALDFQLSNPALKDIDLSGIDSGVLSIHTHNADPVAISLPVAEATAAPAAPEPTPAVETEEHRQPGM